MATTPALSLCVYCASRSGTELGFAQAAREVGTLIGRRGWQLVYGGGRAGLMGQLADAALAAGARVVGVIPKALMVRELGHPGLAELHVVDTMHQRKQLMAERSDAFLALPGGIGTLEELFEVWTWRQLGYHDKPVGVLNVGGYYDALLDFLHATGRAGFVPSAQLELLQVASEAPSLLDRLETLARAAHQPDDYHSI
jgi:uncharacterized protein (TIGR00730 family)